MVSKDRRSKKWLLVLILVLAAGASFMLYFTVFHVSAPRQSVPQPTIKQLPKEPAVHNGEKQVNTPTGTSQGTSKDNHGATPSEVTTSPGQWAASKSGLLTLKQPIAGDTIKSGATIIGSATVSKVQYRLIDNQAGVISQGFISVVDGNFSASISFQPHGTSGRLDVFSTDTDGAEQNEVQVPVNF